MHGREWSGGFDIKAVELTRGIASREYDCVVIVTDHKAFDYDALVAEADLIVDTRNAIKTAARARVQARRAAVRRSEGEKVAVS